MAVKTQVKSDDLYFAILLAKAGRSFRGHPGSRLLSQCRSDGVVSAACKSTALLLPRASGVTDPGYRAPIFRHALKQGLGGIRKFAVTGLLGLMFALPCPGYTGADDPMEILQKTRLNQTAHFLVLEGQVRHRETANPFRMTLDGAEIKYEFTNPDQTLVLQFGEKGSRLQEVTGKGAERTVTEAQYAKTVHGTDITYEDLSMRFLYWPVAKIAGEEVMLTRNCWKLRVEPGSPKNSQYGYVMLWIEKQSGSLVRVETYDRGGNLLKRFEVKSVQKVDGGYILKQMRIQKIENGSFGEPTYLEIKKPEEK